MGAFDRFTEFENKFAPGAAYGEIAEERLQKMQTAGIADFYIAHLREHGLMQYGHGFWWQLDPSEQAEQLQSFTQAQGALPILRSAFGNFILLIEGKYQHLDTQGGRLSPLGSDLGVLLNHALTDDIAIKRLFYGRFFADAVAREGELEPDEMYAFIPALALGGQAQEGNARRVKVREQLALLEQL